MKNNNKISSNDDYSLLRFISFIFPIIGLTIYAVNVGKNEYLAKESSKWAIRGMITAVIIIIIAFIIIAIITPQNTTISGTRY